MTVLQKRVSPTENIKTKVKVINISKHVFTPSEVSLLEKGPKSCPTTKGNYLHAKSDAKDFTRKLKLKEKYYDSNFVDNSLVKAPSNTQVTTDNLELQDIIEKIEFSPPTVKEANDNLTTEERRSLQKLKSNNEITIKKADKVTR